MDPNYSPIIELLSEKLVLMQQLAEALEQGQKPLLTLELESIRASTSRQQTLCRELGALAEPLSAEFSRPAVIRRGDPQLSNEPDADAARDRLRKQHPDLLAQYAAIEQRVRHLNLVYAALLRKTRQSFAVMKNLRCADAITYAEPGGCGMAEDATRSRSDTCPI